MAEYIEREALMHRIKEIHCAECDSYHGVRCRACWVDNTLDYIDSEPAADVAPVRHGRRKKTIKIKLDPGAYMPERAHEADAGLDIKTPDSFSVPAGGQITIDTGIHIAIPAGHVGLITSKSGLMLKGITSRGTVDSGYTGSIKAVLFNHSQSDIAFQKGQKITQLVVLPIINPELEIVASLDETDRGAGGFGSSGK